MGKELNRVHSLKAVSRLDPCWIKPLDKPLCNAKKVKAARLDGGQWVVWWSKNKASLFPDDIALLCFWDIWV